MDFPSLPDRICVEGEVVWSRPLDSEHFLNGIHFTDQNEYLHARLVEQMCEIQRYQHIQADRYGRRLSINQAAEEWIRKFAEEYPL